MDNPLFNLYVLEIVFNHCKLTTLLNCRLVCQAWNEEVLRALERVQLTAFLKGQEDIVGFLECLKSSENHPYSRFWIELPPEQESEALYQFLDQLKERVKYIKFEYEPQSSSVMTANADENASKIEPVMITLSELESLHLFTTNLYPPESEGGSYRLPNIFNTFILPNLTSLAVQHLYDTDCAETVKRLVNSSSKAITYLKFPCNELPKITGDVNLIQLKELDICDLFHSSFATNQTIQCIIESCPNLQRLSVEFGCRVSFEWIFKLFQALSHSVQYLKLIVQDRNLLSRTIQRVDFHFPHMPKLKNLFLRYTNPGLVYYIDGMPELQALELETPFTRKVKGNIFPGIENRIYDQLRILKLSEILTALDVQKINKVFPCLNTLSASFENDEALQEVYQNLSNLECLVVDRKSSITETGICGISDLENCSPEFLTSQVSLEKYRSFKTAKAIGNLEKLTTLKLVQIDLTWKSLLFGVTMLKNLHSFSVQAHLLRIDNLTIVQNDKIPRILSDHLLKLKDVTLWIRRNAERLNELELEYLNSHYSQWDVNVVNQTQCSSL